MHLSYLLSIICTTEIKFLKLIYEECRAHRSTMWELLHVACLREVYKIIFLKEKFGAVEGLLLSSSQGTDVNHITNLDSNYHGNHMHVVVGLFDYYSSAE